MNKLIPITALLGLAFLVGVLGVPQSQQYDLSQDWSQSGMTPEEAQAYQLWLLQQQQLATQSAYETSPELEVTCPVGTRGLSIPPAHVKFWKQHKLTRGLSWSGNNRFMCVPIKLRSSLTPIIAKLKKEEVINIDPLTNKKIMKDINTVKVVAPVNEDVDVEKEIQKAQFIDALNTQMDVDQQVLDDMTNVDQFETKGIHGFGPGFGFGRWGWGGYPGWGFGRFGLGLGLGYGGLGYGLGAWAYPGFGWGGLAYPALGFGGVIV